MTLRTSKINDLEITKQDMALVSPLRRRAKRSLVFKGLLSTAETLSSNNRTVSIYTETGTTHDPRTGSTPMPEHAESCRSGKRSYAWKTHDRTLANTLDRPFHQKNDTHTK